MNNDWVKNPSPWIKHSLEEWEPVIKNNTPIRYKKRSFLFNQGDASTCVYIVIEGRIRATFYNEDGAEKQLYIAERGCCLGETCCIMGFDQVYSAFAIVDSLVCKVPAEQFLRTMKDNWNFNMLIFNFMFRKKTVFRNQVLDLSFTQAIERIARLLLNLCAQYGEPWKKGYKIKIKFTHSEVASMINASRVTVSNIFSKLLEQGILIKDGGYFLIPDSNTLRDLAVGGSDLSRSLIF